MLHETEYGHVLVLCKKFKSEFKYRPFLREENDVGLGMRTKFELVMGTYTNL